jgi:hypothetical protein
MRLLLVASDNSGAFWRCGPWLKVASLSRTNVTKQNRASAALKYVEKYISHLCVLAFVIPFSGQTEFQGRFRRVLASNADTCTSCHSTPRVGGSSNVIVTRFQPRNDPGNIQNSFVVHSENETGPKLKEGSRGERLTISLMGDAYIEAVDERSIMVAQQQQQRVSNSKIAGYIVRVPALEAPAPPGPIGKFGWKGQHSSLFSACADSMLNELGIPNQLYPAGTTSRQEDKDALVSRMIRNPACAFPEK